MKGINAVGVILGVISLLIFAVMIPIVNVAMDTGTPFMDEATKVVFQLIPLIIALMIMLGIFLSPPASAENMY